MKTKTVVTITLFLFSVISYAQNKKELLQKMTDQEQTIKKISELRKKEIQELNDTIKFYKNKTQEQAKVIVDLSNTGSNLLATGIEFEKQKDYDSALETYEKLVTLYPTSKEAIEAQKRLLTAKKEIEKIENERRIAEATENINSQYDEFQRTTFYNGEGSYLNGTRVYVYFSKKDGAEKVSGLRIVFKYYGSDWIFAKSVQFRIDGKDYFYSCSFKREIADNGRVYEIADIPVDNELQAIIKALQNNKEEAKIRFKGKKTYDNDLNFMDVERIKNVLVVYNQMGGVF